jgi:hypothetical protein
MGAHGLLAMGLAASAFAILSCGESVKADAGADAYMRLAGAQFVRGPMPAGSSSGPAVANVALIGNGIYAGFRDDPITGALGPSATAAAIGLQGDVGYWVVTAGVPSISTPDDPSFSASAAFSSGIVPGDYTLVVRAVDASGRFGSPSTQVLTAGQPPLNAPPQGALVVTLTWDTESDLDLHVVDPMGNDVFWGNQSSQPPFAFNQVDGGSYGFVDGDSNANCSIDGLRREDALWPSAPPSGTYTVRVDAASLCGQPIANWTVRVQLLGTQVGQASGVALDADTRGSHGTGAGLTALQLTVP